MQHRRSRTYNEIIIALAIIMVAVTILTPCTSYGSGEEKKVKVGYFQLDGFNDISSKGQFSGYGYEYLMEISKYTGWKYEFIYKYVDTQTGKEQRLTYEKALKMLESGELDLVCSVKKNEDTEKRFLIPAFPMGSSYGILSVSAEEPRAVQTEGFPNQDTLIGVVAESTRNQGLESYLKEKKIKCEIREYATVEQATDELLKGNIDAVYADSLRNIEGEKAVLHIEPSAFYTAVNKQRKDLCKALDRALEDIFVNSPNFSARLYYKYFGYKEDDKFELTAQEKMYIKKNPVVIVGIDPNFQPIEYCEKEYCKGEDGHVSGISGDVLQRIGELTGLRFKTVSYTDYKKAGTEGVQIFPSYAADYGWADRNQVRLTTSYLNVPISVVVGDGITDYTSPKLTVAVLRGYYMTEHVKETMGSDTFLYCATMKECVDAVNEGEADISFIPTYSADYFTSSAKYTRIRTHAVPEFNYDLAFAATDSCDAMLYQIISKSLRNIPKSEINNMVLNTVLFNETNQSLTDYIYRYPIAAIGAVCILWIVLILCFAKYKKLKIKVHRELYMSEERIHIALEQTNTLIWDYDLKERKIIRVKGSRCWVAAPDEIPNVPESLIESGYVHPEHEQECRQMFDAIQRGDKVATGLFRVIRIEADGKWTKEYLWVEIKITNIFDKEGGPIGAVGLAEDVTAKVNEELRLKDRASRDPLTDLLNRMSFQICVQEFLNKEYKDEYLSALILIDTDDFKVANDTYGHFYGDEVLRGIAERLAKCFRAGDFIGRLGGDEFVIFMKNAKTYKAIEEKARQICNSLVFEKDDLITTCSVGIVIVPNKYVDYNTLYKYADEAMYEAKKFGKCRYVINDISNLK